MSVVGKWSVTRSLASWIAGCLDTLGPLAFARRRNFDLGWGDDLGNLIARDYQEVAGAAHDGRAPAVRWVGSWEQKKSSREIRGKFSFLEPLRRWFYGASGKMVHDTLLVRDGFFASPYSEFLEEGSKEAHFRCIVPMKPGMSMPRDGETSGLGGLDWDGKIAIHFPATGDEGYSMRSAFYAAPLAAQDGVASVTASIQISTISPESRWIVNIIT